MKVITDKDYLPVLLALLGSAKKQIDIMAFSFAIGSAAGKIDLKGAPYQIALKLRDIKKKHGRKMRIRLYIEGLRDTIDRNRVTAEFLEEAGIEVVYGATHAKGFCIDQKKVLFGSTNLTGQSILRNPEANLIFTDKVAVREFMRYFEHLWEGGTHGSIKLKPPMFADGDFKDAVIDLIGRAKKQIEFSIYFFDHREIEKALIKAHQRGIKITGLIHRHNSFAMSYIMRNYRTVKRLRDAGLEDLHFGAPIYFSHSKYIIRDRKEYALGTGNWLVEDVKIHPQLYISQEDAAVAKELVKHLKGQLAR